MGSKVAAILAILSVLVVHGSCKGHPVNYNVSDASAYGSGWLPARATWYGAPTGAGPDDNGAHFAATDDACGAHLCFCLVSELTHWHYLVGFNLQAALAGSRT